VNDADSALEGSGALAVPRRLTAADKSALHELLLAHFDFIWRSLRRLGVPEDSVDDAAQQVFVVASRKIDRDPPRAPKAFLFAIALRVAASHRRSRDRRRLLDSENWTEVGDSAPGPDELLERRRARQELDEIVESIPFDIRVVFMLFEMEEMTTKQIAELMNLPMGTVASRLRRGRELFQQGIERLKARRNGGIGR
jgi:RNA polymerase sigma-70 factor (ECF subfamily)